MFAINTPPSLTGRYRLRLSRWLRLPIVEVEEQQECIASMRRPPVDDNIVMGYAWRKARSNDLLALKQMGVEVGA